MKKFYEMTDEELNQTLETLSAINSEEVNSVVNKIKEEQEYRKAEKERKRLEAEKKAQAEKNEKTMLENQKEVLGKYFVDKNGIYYKVRGVFEDYAIVETSEANYFCYFYKPIELKELLSYDPATKEDFEKNNTRKMKTNVFGGLANDPLASVFNELLKF